MERCNVFDATWLVTPEESLCGVKAGTDSFRQTHTHTAEIGAECGYKPLSLISYFPVVTVKLTFSVPDIPVNGSLG